jgi:hypothetical protein
LLLTWIDDYNLANRPIVQSYSLNQSCDTYNELQFHGDKLAHASAYYQEDECALGVTTISDKLIFVKIPADIKDGYIFFKTRELRSNKFYFVIPDKEHKIHGFHEVLQTDIALFSDSDCKHINPLVRGIKIKTYEPGKTRESVRPCKQIFQIGDYIIDDIVFNLSSTEVVNEDTWCREPLTGEAIYCFTASIVYKFKQIGRTASLKNIGIELKPNKIKIYKDEIYTPQVYLKKFDGVRLQIELLTSGFKLSSEDESMAFIDMKKNQIIAKKLGVSKIHCHFKEFHAVAVIEISNFGSGDGLLPFFVGLSRMQKICFDSDGDLLVTNQNPKILKINKEAKLDDNFVRLADIQNHEQAIDMISLNNKDDLFIRTPGHIYNLKKEEDYLPHLIKEGCFSDVKCADDGSIYIGGYNKQLIKFKDGVETVFDTIITPLSFSLTSDKIVIIGGGGSDIVAIYSLNGELIYQDSWGNLIGPVDILIEANSAYIAGFRSKNIVKFNLTDFTFTELIKLPCEPGGLAYKDPFLYVSIFGVDESIYRIVLD